ncbi:30S ribosome-binding factor RbfA [Salinisphaera aquimarina]|uniref:Ribosome-binding factor A n=1 Tax=Salinisphaera aquimarina TaxID=2094031 RepID=A0ABV7ESK7_9GAMM
MPREFKRKDRVADQIKRELGVLLTTEVKDPRVRLVAITDVNVSADFKHAKVFFGSFDVTAANEKAPEVLEGLRAASGYLKRELSKRLRLRTVPELRFFEDATEREAQRLAGVIKSAVAEDRLYSDADDGDSIDEAPREDDGTA